MIRKLTLALLLVWTCQVVHAQSFSEDIADLNFAYLQLNRKMTITSSISGIDGKSSSSETVAYMKSIDHCFMVGNGTEILIRDGIKVAINHELKIVMLDSNKKDSKEDIPITFFESLPQYYSKIEHGKSAGTERYTLEPKVGNTKTIELNFDRNTMLFANVSVTLLHPRTRQNYTVQNAYRYAPLNSSDIPSISRFVNLSTLQLQGNLTDYQLINYLEN